MEFKCTHQSLVLLVNVVRIDFAKQLMYGTEKLHASDITPTMNKVETAYAIVTEAALQ
jgi:hypothetical protein